MKQFMITMLGGAVSGATTVFFMDMGLSAGFALFYAIVATFIIMWVLRNMQGEGIPK